MMKNDYVYNSLSQKWPLHRGIRRADSRSPPPRNSDDSSNSVSSTAMKQVWARLIICALQMQKKNKTNKKQKFAQNCKN